MKAAVRDTFGPPDVIEVREVEEPVAADGEVFVRVRVASVNAFDWYAMMEGRTSGAPAWGCVSRRTAGWESTSPGRSKRSART